MQIFFKLWKKNVPPCGHWGTKKHVNSNNTEYANIILSNALEFIVDKNIKDNKLNVNYGIDEAFRNTGGGNSESAPEIYTIDSINLS